MKIILMTSPLRDLRKGLLGLIMGLAVLLLASCNNNAEQIAGGSSSTETGEINLTGRVIGSANAPISGIIVTLAKAGLSDTTDSLGRYRIQRNLLTKASMQQSASAATVLDTLIFSQNGQIAATLGVTNLVDSLQDVKIVQRNFAGNLLPSPVQIGKVEGVLSGAGISASQPLVAQFYYNPLSNDYSGFIYSLASDSLQNYSVHIKIFDPAGHLTGQSQTVPFNSYAGDITIPPFNPGNAIPTAVAGHDTSVHLNDFLTLRGSAVDSFGGTIVKWEWDIGGTGVFKTTSTADTTFQASSQFPRSFACVLRVTDNDGNLSPNDTLIVSIDSPSTPIVTLNTQGLTTANKRPTWTWRTGGGGDGIFRFKLDDPNLSTGSTQTTALSFTPTSDLALGGHTLYVQEINPDQNWSATGSGSTWIIDTTTQALVALDGGNMALNGGDSILISKNGGITWVNQVVTGISNPNTLTSVYFVNANTGWTVESNSGIIRTTSNGGTTWTPHSSGLNPFGGGGTTLSSIQFVDVNTGWAAGQVDGTGATAIIKTVDGGETWTTQLLPSIRVSHISFVNANTGWAVGDSGSILKTMDGGVTWTAQTSGTSTTSFSFVQFVNADTGWILGGNTVLKTTNGGLNWSQTNLTQGTYNYLNTGYFLDGNTGWVVWEGNDELLKTTNGGTTWTSIDVSFQPTSVYFKNANVGWVVGIGGKISTTTDGGTTWTPQTSGTKSAVYGLAPVL